jgi:putative tryptophan/tyrosine transport system substrate-binding protein
MRRREFMILLGGAAIVWPLVGRAQQPAGVVRVGILSDTASPPTPFEPPFLQGLRDLGWVEGQNFVIERRYAAETTRYEILPSLAAELVSLKPDLIVAIGSAAAGAAKSATQTIPIVFARSADPVGFGLVSSLARPGENVTGVSIQAVDILGKRLQLLSMAVPDAKRVGVLWNPTDPFATPNLREIEEAARSLNLELVPASATGLDDFEPAIRAMVAQRAGALFLVPGILLSDHYKELADLAVKARLPTMLETRASVEMGGLMSYYPSFPDMYRRAAAYVEKILKGAKPADLPVEQPTKFELVINLKTAKALGMTIPPLLLARADEVIECPVSTQRGLLPQA